MTETRATDVPQGARPGRAMNITLWTLQVLLTLIFAQAGLTKLLGVLGTVEGFDEIGAGQWFRYLVGALELAGAIGVLIPALSGLAALGLAGVMVGATITNLFIVSLPAAAVLTIVLLFVCALVAWYRLPQTMTRLGALRH
jgi:hypothetical protein